jgi:hypothetical protein
MNTSTPTPEELREKQAWYQRFGRTEIPLAVYAAIFLTMAVLWVIQEVHPDVTLGFNPEIASGLSEIVQVEAIRQQRATLLSEMEQQPPEKLASHLYETGLFTEAMYTYMNERADDVWDVLNMKYSEYMAPELVLALIRLHTHIKDLCGHIRQHARAERFPEDRDYYHRIGRMGASVSVREILAVVNELKQRGYSEPAALTGAGDTMQADAAA